MFLYQAQAVSTYNKLRLGYVHGSYPLYTLWFDVCDTVTLDYIEEAIKLSTQAFSMQLS